MFSEERGFKPKLILNNQSMETKQQLFQANQMFQSTDNPEKGLEVI